jgi:hypothetical protein
MRKEILCIFLCLFILQVNAQIAVVKMIGKNTSNYSLGYGAFLKGAYPVSAGDDVTLEAGIYFFNLNDQGYGDGTALVPLKVGYRYSINRQGDGFYVEPQAGYNLYGVTSLNNDGYNTQNLKFNGVIFAASTGYILSIKSFPLDLNLHYETIMDKGGSDNYIRLGLLVSLHFKKRSEEY